jgi:PadR family transcriptional regulator, regulatory protein PadR
MDAGRQDGGDAGRRELQKGATDLLILAVLADGEAYGSALARALRQRSGGYFALPQGTLYPALGRLERAGLIAGAWQTEPGPPRRVYTLTEAGRRTLAARLSTWAAFAAAMDAVLFRTED